MANELLLTATLKFEKDIVALSLSLSGLIDVASDLFVHHYQLVGTTEEPIYHPGVTIGGWFVGINRDPTNTIKIRPGSGLQALLRMKPGEFCIFRTDAASVPYAIAITAACNLEYWWFEN